MKDSDCVFVAVPYTSDRTPAPGAAETIVPTSKLAGDNPARDYKIGVGQEVVLVLDPFGNDLGHRFTNKPSVKDLKAAITAVPGKLEKLTKNLQKDLDKAKAAQEKGDRAGAFKAVVSVLSEGVVGLSQVDEAAQIYNSMCDEARNEVSTLKSEGGAEAAKKLDELAKIFSKKAAPGLNGEIVAAKKELASVSK